MLQVHPDSTCDVCLDQYSFSNPAKTPHAIACGHIFCLECLAHLNHPTSCPLCRKAFGIDRVKKLHVDRHIPGGREAATPGAWSLVQRLARCARSEVDIQSTEELIREGQQWLDADNHKELFPEVDAVFSALIKYKSLQERSHDQQAQIGSLSARLHREEAMRDEERKGALVENGLIRKIKELESQLDFYKHHFPGVRDLAREHRPPQINTSTSEDRANGFRVPTPGNPLPSPPRPIWYPFTARNPNFVPPGNSQEPYLRTNVPPIQPYVYQTGAGAVYYEGARYEDRVVPQAVRDMAARDPGPERERARSRSGHRERERSAERRSRRKEGESERDRQRRKRDRHRRDTGGRDDEGLAERTASAGGQPPMGNALGIHPGSHYPGQGLYAPAAPPVTSTAGGVHDPYPSTSRGGGAASTGHGTAPAIVTTVSVSGSRHREVPLSAGPEPSRAARTDHNTRWADPVSRPSSTPTGPLLSSWVAPDLSNPSLNSLGLSAPSQNDGGPNLRAFPAGPTSMGLTPRNSVSSWGTEDSGPTQGDLFSTLRPLAPAPADGGPPASDLLSRPDGQLLGVGRSNQIANPRPQLATMQPLFVGHPDRDADTRPRSRHSHHSRSRTISGSQASVVSSAPQSFAPDDRGFPYAAVPPPPSFPFPYSTARSSAGTPASRPPSHPVPMIPPFPYIPAPQPTTAVSRTSQYTQQPFIYGSSSSLPQNPSHRSHH